MIHSGRLNALRHQLRRCDWRIPLVGAWAVFLLLPVWKTGWVSDDVYSSLLPGKWIYLACTPVDDAFSEIKAWMFRQGRINPLIHILRQASFWVFRDLFWYKTALVAAVLVNLYIFYRLLKRLGASADLAALCCFLAVTLIQFRVFEDPVYSFNGLMQWLFLGTLLSLGTFHRYLKSGQLGWLAVSFLLYLLTALTYEMTYLFWILHAGLFFTTRGPWKRGAAVVPFAAVAVLLTLASLWLRPASSPSQPYSMNLDVRVVVETSLKQITGAWPGSYPLLFPKSSVPVLHDIFTWKTLGAHPVVLAFGFAAAAILMVGVVRRGSGEATQWRRLLVLGLLLAVLPVPLIAVARKYQNVLIYGIAYLPVYIEYFGVALLFASGFSFLARYVRPGGAPAIALVGAASLLCACVAVVHSEVNNRVVAFLREPYLMPRQEVEELLERGRFLEDVPAGATLVVDGFPWDAGGQGNYFYCYHTGTRLKSVLCSHTWDALQVTSLATWLGSEAASNVLRVRYTDAQTEHGWAVAGKLHHLQTAPNGDVSQSEISDLRLAVRRGWHMGPDRPFVLHTAYIAPEGAQTPMLATIRPEEMQRTAVTKNWTVYDVKIPFPYVGGESLWLEFNPPAAGVAQASAAVPTGP
jgi:hypothetical protein